MKIEGLQGSTQQNPYGLHQSLGGFLGNPKKEEPQQHQWSQ